MAYDFTPKLDAANRGITANRYHEQQDFMLVMMTTTTTNVMTTSMTMTMTRVMVMDDATSLSTH